jgi:multimeric flavodoxin WrbA
MKIFAINGNPRKNWNTDTLLRKVLEGAASQNAETDIFHLYDLEYKGCVSCLVCKRKGGEYKCALRDSLTPILDKLETADVLVFGSPIYFMGITAGMSGFLERFLFPYIKYTREVSSAFPRKIPSGFIYTMNAPEEWIETFKPTLNPYERFIEVVFGEKLIPNFSGFK